MQYVKVCCMFIIVLLANYKVNSMPLSYYDTLAIYSDTYIADFNNDNIKDTLVSRVFSDYCLMPKFIIWGKQSGNNDSTNVISSEIIYPKYKQVYSTFSILRANNDTLPDISFTFQGFKFDTTIIGGKTRIERVDTSDIVILFGQKKLNKYSTIRLDTITGNLKYRYYTKRIIDSIDYKKCNSDSKDYFALYQLPKFNINVDSVLNTIANKEPIENSLPDTKIKIYPNPVNNMLYVNLNNYEKNELVLSVFDYSSILLFQDNISVIRKEEIHEYSLSNYFSGKYIVIIKDMQGNIIFTETIVLIH